MMAALITFHHNEMSTLGGKEKTEHPSMPSLCWGKTDLSSPTLLYEFSVLKFWGLLNPHPCHLWTAFDLRNSLLL